MKLEGKLNLKHDSIDYIMFYKGRSTNISEILDTMLLYDIEIRVIDLYTKKVLFDEKGQLIKNRVDKGFYLYHVDGQDLDSVLWNNVGSRLHIEMKNITKE